MKENPMPKTITRADMAQHIARNSAAPLFPEGVPGPVHYAAQWWAIPETEQDYSPVQDPQIRETYDQLARRYAAGVEAVRAEQQAGLR
jgi:hypothetical protein